MSPPLDKGNRVSKEAHSPGASWLVVGREEEWKELT